jgi:hypothetical protein
MDTTLMQSSDSSGLSSMQNAFASVSTMQYSGTPCQLQQCAGLCELPFTAPEVRLVIATHIIQVCPSHDDHCRISHLEGMWRSSENSTVRLRVRIEELERQVAQFKLQSIGTGIIESFNDPVVTQDSRAPAYNDPDSVWTPHDPHPFGLLTCDPYMGSTSSGSTLGTVAGFLGNAPDHLANGVQNGMILRNMH